MAYIEQSLSEDEKVLQRFRLHWTAWLWFALWIVLILPTFGITLLLALYEWLRLRTQEFGVTNKRVVLKKGISRGISDVVFRRLGDPMAVKRHIESVSHPPA